MFPGLTNLSGKGPASVNTAPVAGLTTLSGSRPVSLPVGTSFPGNPTPQNNAAPSGPTPAQVAAQQQAAAAAAAAAAQQAKAQAILNSSVSQAENAAGANTENQYGNLNAQAIKLGADTETGQNTINQARLGIQQHQINSIRDLVNSVRQGLHSGAVQLGNTNALDSSAANAIARAYSDYNTQQDNSINNDAATQQQGQDVQQANLEVSRKAGLDTLKSFRDSAVAQISSQARQALLQAQQYYAMLGGNGSGPDIDGITNQLVQNAQGRLAGVDQYIQGRLAGITAPSQAELEHQAYELSNRGVAPSGGNAISFQVASPQQQLPGAADTQIPIVAKPKVQ